MPRHPIEDFVSSSAFADFKVPELPNLGELIKSEGFTPGLSKFGQLLTAWRTEFERALVERLKQFSAVELSQTAEEDAEVAAAGGIPAALEQLSVELNALIQQVNDALTAHIAATVVHGTTSAVVGINDEQTLESKTIGINQPRYGRFKHLIGGNRVDATETVTIPTESNMVVAGVFEIDGVLNVDGYLTIL